MSALGQKQTFAVQDGMSALPPIATSIAFFGMSALGHKRTSLDHFVGAGEQLRWHRKAERPGSLEIDNKLEFGRCLHRQVARLFAFESTICTKTIGMVRVSRCTAANPGGVCATIRSGAIRTRSAA